MENNLSIVKDQFKELPNNIEAEQAVIGSLLVNNEIFDEISIILDGDKKNDFGDKFYDPMHQKIYNAIESMVFRGMLANPITLKNYFEDEKDEINISEYLVKITKFSTSVRQAIEYSRIIYDMFVRRELIKISEQTVDNAKITDLDKNGQSIIEDTERQLFDLAEKGSFNSSLVKFEDAMKQTIEMASAAYKNEGGIVGVPTGLRDLDDKLGGLHQSDLIIIAGRPSMGKTSLATNIAYFAAENIQRTEKKSSVAFFSLEMSSEQLSTRILSEQAQISSNDIRRGRISDEQFDKFLETSKNIADLPLFIDETPAISIAAMSNRARRIKRLHGLDLIVVDYIQLMRGSLNNKDGRVQEISQITQGLKAIAKELGVPVVALSQLSRQVEQRDDHKPQLADLRESGSIEQDADVVMFVYRESYYLMRKKPREATVEHAEWQAKMNEVAHLAEIIIGKQRHGPIGNITLEFEERFTKFKDTQIN
jgi:replicative DNA helicase